MPPTRLHDRFITPLTSFSFPLPLNFIGDVLVIRIIATYMRAKNKSDTASHNNSLHFIFRAPITRGKELLSQTYRFPGHFGEFAILISFSPSDYTRYSNLLYKIIFCKTGTRLRALAGFAVVITASAGAVYFPFRDRLIKRGRETLATFIRTQGNG